MLEKYNLHDTLIILPNTKFVKYFAVNPIKYYNNRLEVLIQGINDKLSWSIRTDEENIDEKYTYFELHLDWSHEGSVSSYANVFSILTSKHEAIFLGDKDIFIGEDNLNDKFEVLTLSLWGNAIYYGRNSDIKGIDYIDYGKNRRNSIPILLEKIPELTRK